MFAKICGIAALTFFVSASAHAALACNDVKTALARDLVDVDCFESTDLTTANDPADPTKRRTTPFDNSLPGLPAFAFTPRTDRGVISPDAPNHTPISASMK